MISISYKKVQDQDLSKAAWVLLDEACRGRGVDEVRSQIVRGENGKPYIKGNPFFFNLSHSGRYALCVLSDTEIGCDTQKTTEPRQSVLERVLHRTEREYIEAAPDARQMAQRFTRIWVLRESYVKQTGEGLLRSMKSYHFCFEEDQPQLCLDCPSPYGERRLAFKEFEVDGYLCAYCYELT